MSKQEELRKKFARYLYLGASIKPLGINEGGVQTSDLVQRLDIPIEDVWQWIEEELKQARIDELERLINQTNHNVVGYAEDRISTLETE